MTTLRRGKNEDIKPITSEFQELAVEHIIHAGVAISENIGEVLAITFLNNANLKDSTLMKAKLQLFQFAGALAVKDL